MQVKIFCLSTSFLLSIVPKSLYKYNLFCIGLGCFLFHRTLLVHIGLTSSLPVLFRIVVVPVKALLPYTCLEKGKCSHRNSKNKKIFGCGFPHPKYERRFLSDYATTEEEVRTRVSEPELFFAKKKAVT